MFLLKQGQTHTHSGSLSYVLERAYRERSRWSEQDQNAYNKLLKGQVPEELESLTVDVANAILFQDDMEIEEVKLVEYEQPDILHIQPRKGCEEILPIVEN